MKCWKRKVSSTGHLFITLTSCIMVATRQALPGNLPSIYVFILHSDDHNFFLLISSGSVCKNRRYSSSINISLYIFKNIKIYFKIILEIFFFISSIKYVSISFVFVFFILESGAKAGKGIYPERKENINIFPKN